MEGLHIDRGRGEAGAVHQIQQSLAGNFIATVKAAVASVLFDQIFENG